eukprot:77570_1
MDMESTQSERNGDGKIISIWSNGETFVGTWDSSGKTFVGTFIGGKRHGHGIYTKPNGYKFEGEYKDDKRNGDGKLLYSNGDSYDGQWKDDKYNGSGIFSKKNNGDVYNGEWSNGTMHGDVIHTESDGTISKGQFKNGKKDGIWTFPKSGEVKVYENGKLVEDDPTGAVSKDEKCSNDESYNDSASNVSNDSDNHPTAADGPTHEVSKVDKRPEVDSYDESIRTDDVSANPQTKQDEPVVTVPNDDNYQNIDSSAELIPSRMTSVKNKWKFEGEYKDDERNGDGKIISAIHKSRPPTGRSFE